MGDYEKQSVWEHGSRNIIGLMICVCVFLSGFLIHGNLGLYLNLSGFVIVAGGTLGATFLSYRFERLVILLKVLKATYFKPVRNPDAIVEMMVDLSVKKRLKGVLALQMDEEETTIIFLRQAIGLLVDGCSMAQIKEFLNAEMYFFKMRREETCRVLQTMGEIAPAFGLVGSVVGLIGMLSGMGNSAIIMATIPVALTSTLYGIVLANFFF
ncbi:MAG: MotA/TolQ/ExbB proton channel family protein [Thermodesulfobacteriota bacterium]|nr:MotA/TolQ/ExbB proton channel family protein [Thermodesulfobacteriota bacterium]